MSIASPFECSTEADFDHRSTSPSCNTLGQLHIDPRRPTTAAPVRRTLTPRIGDPVHHLHQSCSPRRVARNLLSPQAARAAQRSPTAMPPRPTRSPEPRIDWRCIRTQSGVWARNALWRRDRRRTRQVRVLRMDRGERRHLATCGMPVPVPWLRPRAEPLHMVRPYRVLAVRVSQSCPNCCWRWRPAATSANRHPAAPLSNPSRPGGRVFAIAVGPVWD